MKNQKTLIGILSCNQKELSLKCLNSLMQLEGVTYKVLLLDNGSDDDLINVVKKIFPTVETIKLKRNIGPAGGRNVQIKYFLNSDYDYLFFIDNDAVVDKNTLKELIRVTEQDKKIGAVSARVFYFDKPNIVWCEGGLVRWIKGDFLLLNRGKDNAYLSNEPKEIDAFPYGFGIIKKEVLVKVRLVPDEPYFMYYEETEWQIHFRKLGYKIFSAPKAKIWHKASSSLGMESPSFYYYRTRNRLLFMWRNAPKTKFFLFCFYFFYDFSCNTVLTLYLSKKPEQLRASIIGVLDFIRGRFGKRNLTAQILQKPLCRTLIIRLADKLEEAIIFWIRNIKFLFKRLLKIRLKILLRLDWNLGDEIMAMPMYKAIKEKFPDSAVNVKVRYPELLYNNPYIDEVNDKSGGYDKIFNLKGEDKTQNRLDYLSKKLRIKIKDRIPKVYIQKDEMDKINIIPDRSKNKLKVAISTGAKWKSRQWGVEKFKGLAEYLMNKYDAEMIELGKDCQTIGFGVNLVNKTSVREAAIILKECKLFIGNDSGLVHLALAAGTPTVALFGPLAPFKLIENRNGFFPVWSGISCRGCWSDNRMKYPDICPRGIATCMDSINVNEVAKIIDNCFAKLKNRL